MPYLIDSDVLIDISRGKQTAREYVDGLQEGWALSQVSALELIVGARDRRDLANIDRFLSAYLIVPLRDSTGERAYELLKVYAKLMACMSLIRSLRRPPWRRGSPW